MLRRHTWLKMRYGFVVCLLIVAAMTGPLSPVVHGGHTPESAPPARYRHSLVTVNGRVLLFGGQSNSGCPPQGYCNDLWEFDPGSNTFRQIVPSNASPSPRSDHGAAEFNGRMYVFGGGAPWFSRDLWYFAPGTNTWTQGSTASCFACELDSRLVHLGGYLYLTVWRGVHSRYDPSTDTWIHGEPPKAPSPEQWFGTAPINGKLCSLKADIDRGTPVEVICYDEWTGPYPPEHSMSLSGELQPSILGPAMAWWGNTVWLFGGGTGSYSQLWASKQVWQYTFTDATTVAVTRLPDMPTPRMDAAAAPLALQRTSTVTASAVLAELPIVIFGGMGSSYGAMGDTLIYTVTVSANFVYLPLTMR